MTKVISIISPTGSSNSTCGYCGPPGGRSASRSNHTSAGLVASQLSCEAYQKMIDRGWRRSGTYCYKPNLRRSCCPNYTIKLDALEFKPSKSQRKLVNRWNRFVLSGNSAEGNTVDGIDTAITGKKLPKKSLSLSFLQSIHASEREFSASTNPAQSFEATLEPSTLTTEKYALYEKYQRDIHQDDDNTPGGFKRFLVDSPLRDEPIPYTSTPPKHLPSNYGSYHQMYRIDGVLIAMAVLDILPNCVSSVYFVYDKAWEKYSLGKLSALREVSLAKEIHDAGAPGMGFLYMGFYIHSCPKMRYKADYSPSFLLDPEQYTWHPLSSCVSSLDKHRYACFSSPEHSLEGPQDPGPEPISPVPDAVLLDINFVDSISNKTIKVIPVNRSQSWGWRGFKDQVYSCVNGLGVDLSKQIVFYDP